MPGWLQAFAQHQPITPMVDAVRGLCLGNHATAVLGHPAGHDVVTALVWTAVLTVGFGALAVARFRRG
jgi:ABC-2 type transport system permease protein/oleandomycin transport system permease protein